LENSDLTLLKQQLSEFNRRIEVLDTTIKSKKEQLKIAQDRAKELTPLLEKAVKEMGLVK
jgi:hypothetical protein